MAHKIDEEIIIIKLKALDQTLQSNKDEIFTDVGVNDFIHRKIKEIIKDVDNLRSEKSNE